jgi:hypothetical protein
VDVYLHCCILLYGVMLLDMGTPLPFAILMILIWVGARPAVVGKGAD